MGARPIAKIGGINLKKEYLNNMKRNETEQLMNTMLMQVANLEVTLESILGAGDEYYEICTQYLLTVRGLREMIEETESNIEETLYSMLVAGEESSECYTSMYEKGRRVMFQMREIIEEIQMLLVELLTLDEEEETRLALLGQPNKPISSE